MKSPRFSENPLLGRELRARFRDGRAFALVFGLVTALSVLFVGIYSQSLAPGQSAARNAELGQTIFTRLAWMQTLGWLLLSPALTASSIAYERERGWFDSLLLSPLSPRAIVIGKWGAALLFAALLVLVTLPLQLLLLWLLGGVSARQWALITLLNAACAMCGSAVGLASSAWSPRANTALRTAYGFLLIGFFASLYGAAAAGELPFRFTLPFGSSNEFWRILGRTNPLLRALEISGDLEWQRTYLCLCFLLAVTLFFLWVAAFYARRPLEEAPLIQRKPKPKPANETAGIAIQSHGEVPFFSRLRFANPVLDREVRAKFRMRQPPLAVVISEIILGVLVGFFYLRTLYWAVFEPQYRELIWWGIGFTGLIVTLMAATIMGGNGLSREREGGTWESIRLSLLGPGEILRGKIAASLVTCALFSLPVWPLLLPCIVWSADAGARGIVTKTDLLSAVLVWISSAWSYTLLGLWMGRKTNLTSRASGRALGFATLFLLLSPFALGHLGPGLATLLLEKTHPFVALLDAKNFGLSVAAGYALFQVIFGALIWLVLHKFLTREMNNASEAERR